MATEQDYAVEQVGVFLAEAARRRRARRGRGRLRRRRHQEGRRREDWRHRHGGSPPAAEAYPGFKELQPMVFAGLYPVEGHEYPELREALEKLQPQRCVALLRTGDVHGARLRLPLRLPRAAAHGDRPGAARARVRHGPGHYGAGRALPGHDDRRRGARSRQPGQAAGSPAGIEKFEEPVITAMMLTPSEHVGGILQLCQDKRGVQKGLEYLDLGPRPRHLRAAVQRGRARLLRSS